MNVCRIVYIEAGRLGAVVSALLFWRRRFGRRRCGRRTCGRRCKCEWKLAFIVTMIISSIPLKQWLSLFHKSRFHETIAKYRPCWWKDCFRIWTRSWIHAM